MKEKLKELKPTQKLVFYADKVVSLQIGLWIAVPHLVGGCVHPPEERVCGVSCVDSYTNHKKASIEKIAKRTAHELGHTLLGGNHCNNCIMSEKNIEEIDSFCKGHKNRLEQLAKKWMCIRDGRLEL